MEFLSQERDRKEKIVMTFKRNRDSNEWMNSGSTVNSSPTTPSLEAPPAKKPRHNANPAPYNRPMTPASKSPSVERSPHIGIGFHASSPVFPLDGILTPVSISPNEEIQIEPVDQIIATIVNWGADEIINPHYKNAPFHKNLAAVPQMAFETFDYYQKCVPFRSYLFIAY